MHDVGIIMHSLRKRQTRRKRTTGGNGEGSTFMTEVPESSNRFIASSEIDPDIMKECEEYRSFERKYFFDRLQTWISAFDMYASKIYSDQEYRGLFLTHLFAPGSPYGSQIHKVYMLPQDHDLFKFRINVCSIATIIGYVSIKTSHTTPQSIQFRNKEKLYFGTFLETLDCAYSNVLHKFSEKYDNATGKTSKHQFTSTEAIEIQNKIIRAFYNKIVEIVNVHV